MCTGQSFWYGAQLSRFRTLASGRVVVIGGGDTAASIVVKLASLLNEEVRLVWLTRTGSLFTRSDSFALRRYYSAPDAWVKLPLDVRKKLMATAHEGVVSLRTLNRLDSLRRSIDHEVGDVTKATWNAQKQRVVLSVRYGEEVQPSEYERVVVAVGFDDLSCQHLFPKGFFPNSRDPEEQLGLVSDRIAEDLSYEARLAYRAGYFRRTGLHLPMLAALKRGPGLATLGCLGILSDRILGGYCDF